MQKDIAACSEMVKDAEARLGQEKNGQVVGSTVAGRMLVGLRIHDTSTHYKQFMDRCLNEEGLHSGRIGVGVGTRELLWGRQPTEGQIHEDASSSFTASTSLLTSNGFSNVRRAPNSLAMSRKLWSP